MWPFSSSSSSSSSSPSDSLPSSSGPSSFVNESAQQPQAPPAQQQEPNATSYFSSGQATYSTPNPSSYDPTYQPTAASLFAGTDFDASKLHPLAGLSKDDVEYLDIVDAQTNQLEGARTALPSRGWSDDLCYGTGTTYLSGE